VRCRAAQASPLFSQRRRKLTKEVRGVKAMREMYRMAAGRRPQATKRQKRDPR
jgi:hypothetical protein